MTRAQEKLIVCGSSSYSTINDKSWYSVVKAGLQDIGKVEVCNSIGGYEVINNPQSESSLYFYSNSS